MGGRGGPAAQARRRRVTGANRDELSPLALLQRSALAYPDRPAVRDGERTRLVRAVRRPRLAARHGAPGGGRAAGGARRDALAQPAGAARGAFRRARRARRPVCDQHPAGPARGALHRRALRRAGAVARSRARGVGEPGGRAARACASCGSGPSTRRCSPARRRRRPSWPDSEDRPIAVDYTSGTTGTPKGVVYTHRGAYLGALARSRRDAARACRHVSLVAADVPLQRLVLQLGRRRRRRHERRRAAARARRALARAARRRHAPVRRADRADHPARASRRSEARPRRDRRRRRRSALADDDRGLRGGGHAAHPHVRPHRDVRARRP